MNQGTFRRLQPIALLVWIVVLGFFFANVEVQVEGSAGWAANLPTWRIEKNWLVDSVFEGRPLTGYHVWVFAFMALIFHLPLFLHGRFSLKLEARTLACLAFFWILEDFFWFMLNPAFGVHKLTPQHAWWHKRWLLGLPADYIIFSVVGALVYWYSFLPDAPRRGGNRHTPAAAPPPEA